MSASSIDAHAAPQTKGSHGFKYSTSAVGAWDGGGNCTAVNTHAAPWANAGVLAPCSTKLYAGCWLRLGLPNHPRKPIAGQQAAVPRCAQGFVSLPPPPNSTRAHMCVRLSGTHSTLPHAFAACAAAGAVLYMPGQHPTVDTWMAAHALRSSSLDGHPRVWTGAALASSSAFAASGGGNVVDITTGQTATLAARFYHSGQKLGADAFKGGPIPLLAELQEDDRPWGGSVVLLDPAPLALQVAPGNVGAPTAGFVCVQEYGSAYTAGQGLGGCPREWTPLGGGCILPSTRVSSSVPMSQRDALHTCRAWGGSGLASPSSVLEVELMQALLQGAGGGHGSQWWMGAALLPVQGGWDDWVWLQHGRAAVEGSEEFLQAPAVEAWFFAEKGPGTSALLLPTGGGATSTHEAPALGRRQLEPQPNTSVSDGTWDDALNSTSVRPPPSNWTEWEAAHAMPGSGLTVDVAWGEWRTADNATRLPFLCSLEPGAMCKGGVYFQGGCYSLRSAQTPMNLPAHLAAQAVDTSRTGRRQLVQSASPPGKSPQPPPGKSLRARDLSTRVVVTSDDEPADGGEAVGANAPPAYDADTMGVELPVPAPLTSAAHLRWVVQHLPVIPQHSDTGGALAPGDVIILGSVCSPQMAGVPPPTGTPPSAVSCRWAHSLGGHGSAQTYMPLQNFGNISSGAAGSQVVHLGVHIEAPPPSAGTPPVYSVQAGDAAAWLSAAKARTFVLEHTTAVMEHDPFAEGPAAFNSRWDLCERSGWPIGAVVVSGQCTYALPLGAPADKAVTLLNACGLLGVGMAPAVPHGWAHLRAMASLLRSLGPGPHAPRIAHVGLHSTALWDEAGQLGVGGGVWMAADGTSPPPLEFAWAPQETIDPPSGPCVAVDINGTLRSTPCAGDTAPSAVMCAAPVLDPCPPGWYLVTLPPSAQLPWSTRVPQGVCWSQLQDPVAFDVALAQCALLAPQWGSRLISLGVLPSGVLAAAWRDVAGPENSGAGRVWVNGTLDPTAALQLAVAQLSDPAQLSAGLTTVWLPRGTHLRSICELPAVPGWPAHAEPAGVLRIPPAQAVFTTPSVSATVSPTPSGSVTVSGSVSPTPSGSVTVSGSVSPTPSGSVTVSGSVSPTPSGSVTVSGSVSPTPSGSVTVSGSVSPTPSGSVTVSGSVSPTPSGRVNTPTQLPSVSPAPPYAQQRTVQDVTVSVNITLRVSSVTPVALQQLLSGAPGSAIWKRVLMYRAYGAAYAAVLAPAERLGIQQREWLRLRVVAWFMYPRLNSSVLWVESSAEVPPLYPGGPAGVCFTLTMLTLCDVEAHSRQLSPAPLSLPPAVTQRRTQQQGTRSAQSSSSQSFPAGVAATLAAGVLFVTLNSSLPELQLPAKSAQLGAAARISGQALPATALQGASFGPQLSLAKQLALVVAQLQPSHPLANPPVGGSYAGCLASGQGGLPAATSTWCLQSGAAVKVEYGEPQSPQWAELPKLTTESGMDGVADTTDLDFELDGLLGGATVAPGPPAAQPSSSSQEQPNVLQLALVTALPIAALLLAAAAYVAYRRRAGLPLRPLARHKTAPATVQGGLHKQDAKQSQVLRSAPMHDVVAPSPVHSPALEGHVAPLRMDMDSMQGGAQGSFALPTATTPPQHRETLARDAVRVHKPHEVHVSGPHSPDPLAGAGRHVSLGVSTRTGSAMPSDVASDWDQHVLGVAPASLHSDREQLSLASSSLQRAAARGPALQDSAVYGAQGNHFPSGEFANALIQESAEIPLAANLLHTSGHYSGRDSSGAQLSAVGSGRHGVASVRGFSETAPSALYSEPSVDDLPGIGARQMAETIIDHDASWPRGGGRGDLPVQTQQSCSDSWLTALYLEKTGGTPRPTPVQDGISVPAVSTSGDSSSWSATERGTVWSGASIDTEAVMAGHAVVMGDGGLQELMGPPRTPPAAQARITLHDALQPPRTAVLSNATSAIASAEHPSAVQPQAGEAGLDQLTGSSSSSGSGVREALALSSYEGYRQQSAPAAAASGRPDSSAWHEPALPAERQWTLQ